MPLVVDELDANANVLDGVAQATTPVADDLAEVSVRLGAQVAHGPVETLHHSPSWSCSVLNLDTRVSLRHSFATRSNFGPGEAVARQKERRVLWGANVVLEEGGTQDVPEEGAILVLLNLQAICHEALVVVASVAHEPRIHG